MSRKNRNARRIGTVRDVNPIIGVSPAAEHITMCNDTCGYAYRSLMSNLLETDTSYQRKIDEACVDKIVANFDARLVNTVKVSNRDGHFFVFDGAHTLTALKRMHGDAPFSVDCKVFSGLTYEDEAYLFALQNGNSKEVAFKERLNAMLLSNSEEAVDFKTHTRNAGFTLADPKNRSNKKYTINCLAKAYKLYTELKGDEYEQLLLLIASTWSGAIWSATQYMLGGVAMLMKVYCEEFSAERFTKKLYTADYEHMRAEAERQSVKSTDVAHAIAIGKLYNRGASKGSLELYRLTVME